MIAWFLSPLGIMVLTLTVVVAVLSRLRWGWRTGFAISAAGVALLTVSYQVASVPLPGSVDLPAPSVVYDRHGDVIGTYSEVNRVLIDTRRLPPYVRNAVVAAEDREFFRHGGLSVRGMLRAAWTNLVTGRIAQGGSTIPQQYVKVAILEDGSRTLVRKIREAVLAVKLSQTYSKDQILDFYLNTIYLGRGSYGIEAAARAYFERPASEITLAQAAFLAGIIRAPEAYQPDEDPDAARARRNAVLDAMAAEGFISSKRAERARGRRLVVSALAPPRDRLQRAAYFLEWLRDAYLWPEFGECLYTCGLRIHTTLDLGMQRAAEAAVTRHLAGPADPQAALVALTPDGRVRALVGGRPPRDRVAATGFNFATDFPGRHAGSALKPFTLLAALESGVSPSSYFAGPASMSIDDCPSRAGPWQVDNFGGGSFGSVSLDAATAYSVNTVYAQVVAQIGPERVASVLEDVGLGRRGSVARREIDPYCSLALGALDVTPLELTRAYAALANDGQLPEVRALTFVEDQEGVCVKAYTEPPAPCEDVDPPVSKSIADPVDTRRITEILAHTIDYGTGTEARLPAAASGKTGTSQNHSDAWFAGYTGDLVATVWVGYPADEGGLVPQMRACDRARLCRPVRGDDVTGGTIPARIWARFMAAVSTRAKIAGQPGSSIRGTITTGGDEAILPSAVPAQTGRPAPTAVRPDLPTPAPSDAPPLPIPVTPLPTLPP